MTNEESRLLVIDLQPANLSEEEQQALLKLMELPLCIEILEIYNKHGQLLKVLTQTQYSGKKDQKNIEKLSILPDEVKIKIWVYVGYYFQLVDSNLRFSHQHLRLMRSGQAGIPPLPETSQLSFSPTEADYFLAEGLDRTCKQLLSLLAVLTSHNE